MLGYGSFHALGQVSEAGSLRLSALNRVPHSRIKPGEVLALQATVANAGNDAQEAILVVTIDGQANRQSVRKVVVPANNTSMVDVFVNVPSSVVGKNLVDVTAALYVERDGQEVVVPRGPSQPPEYTLQLGPDPQPTQVAFILKSDSESTPAWYWPQPLPAMNYEFALASRIDTELNRRGAVYDARPFPNSSLDWSSLETVILDDEAALRDAAFVASLREFMAGGGKLWVMLDQVSSEAVRPLLGPEQICETVDTVAMSDFTVKVIGGENPIAEQDRTVSSYSPLMMKRVIHHGGRVTHEVDGWPAAIWMPVGYGTLLLTTLDAAAWLQVRENPSSQEPFFAAYQSRIWANQLSIEINMPSLSQPLSDQVDYPMKLIGNPVVPKPWVVTTLAAFCALLGLAGVWRWLAGDLSWLGILAPVVGLIFGGAMLLAASYVRRDIPESVARLQLIQVNEDGSLADVREQSAVYLENSADMSLVSDLDGGARVDEQLASGVVRFEIDDFRKWSLKNTAWPPGPWRYESFYTIPTQGLVAEASLTADGVEVLLPQLPYAFEDAVLGFNRGDPMICQAAGDNRLIIDGSLSADGDRWIAGTLISSEQQRRLEVYQDFFRPDDRTQNLDRVLYGWTKIWPESPKWTKDLMETGAALVSLPVRLSRPAAGETVFVPHGLVKLQRDLNQPSATFAYSDTTGKWQKELTMAISADLQFVLPDELLPFQAESMDLELDIKAPQRDVVVLVTTADGPVEVGRLSSPSIPWNATITDPRVLAEAADGVINVALQVGERKDIQSGTSSANVVAWQVDNFRASFRGSVAVPSN